MHATRPWLRPLAMRLHRWMALTLGAWFAVVGLTGAVLVWHAELDRTLNPQWFAPRAACSPVSTPIARALQVFAQAAPGAVAAQVMAPATPGAAYTVWAKPGADGLRVQHFVDPDCGLHLGQRRWGAARLDRAHAVPALYELHRSLLSGEVGHVVVGLAGLGFLGVALTGAMTAWPRHFSRADWKRVFTIKRGATPRRRYYDLHRATGAWLCAFLVLMSLTGAYLCFPKQGRALVAAILPTLPASMGTPAVATVTGDAASPDTLVAAAEHRFAQAQWSRLQLPAKAGDGFDVRLLQQGEPRLDTGDTRVRLDARAGVIDMRDPLRAPAGDTLLAWLFPLHSGEALGLSGRLAWSAFGLAPPLLLVTGVWLWWQRRRAVRRHAAGLPNP